VIQGVTSVAILDY